MKLNRKAPYSEIYGHSIAKYYQGGNYFNGSGDLVSEDQASKTHGLTRARIQELEKEELDLDETVASDVDDEPAGEPVVEPPADEPPAKLEDPAAQERYEQLVKLHHTALVSMATDLFEQMIKDGVATGDEGIPFAGEGSKERNARWIADHTE